MTERERPGDLVGRRAAVVITEPPAWYSQWPVTNGGSQDSGKLSTGIGIRDLDAVRLERDANQGYLQ